MVLRNKDCDERIMVSLIFYGGAGEIGGNKILLTDGDTRILLDFGMNFAERSKFYSTPWLEPRDERGFLEFGLLPKIEGTYEFDEGPAQVDAVFLSHSHTDHTTCLPFLKKKIPVYCGQTTELLLRAFNETTVGRRSFEKNIEGFQFNTFRTGSKIKVGSLEVEPIHVDHSVPGSYGFIVHTSEGAVVYSGDFRIHGARGDLTADFVDAAAKSKPIAMICEGTNLTEAEVSTEQEVQSKIGQVVKATPKLVLADFRPADVDRIRTFYQSAKENGRQLAISLKQAYILEKLKADRNLELPEVDSPEFLIFQREKKRYFNWESAIADNYPNVVDAERVGELQSKVILSTSYSDFNEMLDIRPEPGSSFIFSTSEPFNEELEIKHDKYVNWLDHFGLPMYHIHCSGHIMPMEARQVVAKVAPKKFFPVHTENPGLFARFVSDITKVELPQKGTTYEIS
jgi:ribonuclease J